MIICLLDYSPEFLLPILEVLTQRLPLQCSLPYSLASLLGAPHVPIMIPWNGTFIIQMVPYTGLMGVGAEPEPAPLWHVV